MQVPFCVVKSDDKRMVVGEAATRWNSEIEKSISTVGCASIPSATTLDTSSNLIRKSSLEDPLFPVHSVLCDRSSYLCRSPILRITKGSYEI